MSEDTEAKACLMFFFGLLGVVLFVVFAMEHHWLGF